VQGRTEPDDTRRSYESWMICDVMRAQIPRGSCVQAQIVSTVRPEEACSNRSRRPRISGGEKNLCLSAPGFVDLGVESHRK
jgi:hypothetical protein